MEKKELKKFLISLRIETKAKLNFFSAIGKFEERVDRLLDRLNTIDKMIEELEKEEP